jgi:ribosomal protein S3AE
MPTSALMTTLMALVENYIKDIVTEQVTAILTNHRTLRFMDDAFKDQIKEIATEVASEAISTHNDEEYHVSEDAINDMAVSAIEDHDFDSQISEAVNDAINEFDFEDIVRTAIKDNITFSVSVD